MQALFFAVNHLIIRLCSKAGSYVLSAWGETPIEISPQCVLMLRHESTGYIGCFTPSVWWRRFLLWRACLRWQWAGVDPSDMLDRIFSGRIP